jgi:hypothetical protein
MGESSGFTGNTNKSRFFDPMVFQYKVVRFPAFVIDQGAKKRSAAPEASPL